MVYWLVALPSDSSSSEGTWSSLQEETTYGADLSVNFKFAVPDFRVGTLDTLLGLSDDLVKVNGAVEGTVNKIRRQLFELQRVAPGAAAEEDEDEPATAADDAGTDVAVEGSSPQDYLQHFVWQEAKFPVKRALKDTVAAITEVVQKLDDDLKVRRRVLDFFLRAWICFQSLFGWLVLFFCWGVGELSFSWGVEALGGRGG